MLHCRSHPTRDVGTRPIPTHIPHHGGKDILSRTWNEFSQDFIMSAAASVTSYAVLTVLPAFEVFVSIFGPS